VALREFLAEWIFGDDAAEKESLVRNIPLEVEYELNKAIDKAKVELDDAATARRTNPRPDTYTDEENAAGDHATQLDHRGRWMSFVAKAKAYYGPRVYLGDIVEEHMAVLARS
jgi:hypothetical protein